MTSLQIEAVIYLCVDWMYTGAEVKTSQSIWFHFKATLATPSRPDENRWHDLSDNLLALLNGQGLLLKTVLSGYVSLPMSPPISDELMES